MPLESWQQIVLFADPLISAASFVVVILTARGARVGPVSRFLYAGAAAILFLTLSAAAMIFLLSSGTPVADAAYLNLFFGSRVLANAALFYMMWRMGVFKKEFTFG